MYPFSETLLILDIQALLGHESIATTQIYTHAGQERLSKLVADI
jgi:integrase/recombinase XerD